MKFRFWSAFTRAGNQEAAWRARTCQREPCRAGRLSTILRRTMAKGLKDAIERLVGNPAYDFGVAIVALFCGTALSQIVSTGQSFRVFPVCCWDPAQAQFTAASWFWSSLVVWVFFFWGQQHVSGIQRRAAEAAQIEERKFRDSQNAAQEERRKAEEEQRKFQAEQKALAEERRKAEEEIQQALRQQEEAQKQIQQAQETLPGDGFRNQFALRSDDLQWFLLAGLLYKQDATSLQLGIRELLSAVAHLASVYGDSGDALCKAHVMTYVEPVAESDVGSLCAVPEGVNPLAAYRGYLISDSLLAATMKGLDPGGVEVFSLGIPVVGLLGREGTTPVMLGPQLAFFSAEMSGIPDVSKQEVLARAVGLATAAAFGKFLGDARNPFKGSLVSFPLGMPQGRTVPRKNIGVVTVYSDRPGIMGGRNERWRVYSMVMRPYMDGIAALLSVLQTS